MKVTRRTVVTGAAGLLASPVLGRLIGPSRALAQPAPRFLAATMNEPDTLDLTSTRSRPVSEVALRNIAEMLWGYAADGSVVPTVADWDASPDGKVITFKIHPGVKFHSGDELTAEDVVFSQARSTARAPTYVRHARYVDKVEALDKYTARFTFKRPDVGFFDGNELFLVSKAYYDRVGEQQFVSRPSGVGPYRMTDYRQGQYMDLVRFDDYYGKKPQIESARIYFIIDDVARLNKLKAGEVDIIMGVPYSQVAALTQAGFDTVRLPANPTVSLGFDLVNVKTPWHDLRVRKAIAHAIDTNSIVNKLFQGVAVYYPYLAPGEAGYDPTLKGYDYDLAKAKALLAEAGYANGFKMPLYYLANSYYGFRDTAEAVALFVRAIGIECDIRSMEYVKWSEFVRKLTTDPNGEFTGIGPAPIANSGLSTTEMLTISFSSRSPYALHKSAALDAKIDAALGELDPVKRSQDVADALRIVNAELPSITLWDTVSVYGSKRNVHYTPTQHRMPSLQLRQITLS